VLKWTADTFKVLKGRSVDLDIEFKLRVFYLHTIAHGVKVVKEY